MTQQRVQKQRSGATAQAAHQDESAATHPAPADLNDVDSLLAEIDGVLEENAAEFVHSYVQKGGE